MCNVLSYEKEVKEARFGACMSGFCNATKIPRRVRVENLLPATERKDPADRVSFLPGQEVVLNCTIFAPQESSSREDAMVAIKSTKKRKK